MANVKKQQFILLSGALVLFIVFFFFGKTIPPKKSVPKTASSAEPVSESTVSAGSLLTKAKQKLTSAQVEHVNQLQNAVIRGDIKKQQIDVYRQLASFWGDSIHEHHLGIYYLAEAAKLENSEKNLNFAARLFLDGLQTEADPATVKWMGLQAKALLEKSLEINPDNDSAKVGIGVCYLFGNISEAPMQGIQMVRQVLEKDPTNAYAHLVLGLGSIRSGQLDRAVEHFEAVLKTQPENLEAIFSLAEAYERKGDKVNAVKWYTMARNKINVPEARKEIDERIKALQ